jgi:hypothetical protein
MQTAKYTCTTPLTRHAHVLAAVPRIGNQSLCVLARTRQMIPSGTLSERRLQAEGPHRLLGLLCTLERRRSRRPHPETSQGRIRKAAVARRARVSRSLNPQVSLTTASINRVRVVFNASSVRSSLSILLME